MKGIPLTSDEAVTKVLRSYDRLRRQGYDHQYAAGFIVSRLGISADTLDKALSLRDRRTGSC